MEKEQDKFHKLKWNNSQNIPNEKQAKQVFIICFKDEEVIYIFSGSYSFERKEWGLGISNRAVSKELINSFYAGQIDFYWSLYSNDYDSIPLKKLNLPFRTNDSK